MSFQRPTLAELSKAMSAKGYKMFEDPRGYDLNIIGIRTADMEANTFNDWLCVAYVQHGIWNLFHFPATTDPGTYWRQHPMNALGTAMLKPGQYRGGWKLGKHKGKYNALVQGKDVTVYRDPDRDNLLEPDEGNTETGMFGINIHRSNPQQASANVDKWSAGCQVFSDPMHFDFFMALVNKSAELYGPHFTYTLLTERDFS